MSVLRMRTVEMQRIRPRNESIVPECGRRHDKPDDLLCGAAARNGSKRDIWPRHDPFLLRRIHFVLCFVALIFR